MTLDSTIKSRVPEFYLDWICEFEFSSLTGTFSFLNGVPSTQQSMSISGGFKWGTTAAESCQISMAIAFYTDGSGTITGSVCGYAVNASF